MSKRSSNKTKSGLLFTDGGARGNPGPAAIGGIVMANDRTQVLAKFSKCIGETTNNIAEYKALMHGIELASNIGITELTCFLDSELVVRQLKGEYKVKEPKLKKPHLTVMKMKFLFTSIIFIHIPREQNKPADKLVNKALDRK